MPKRDACGKIIDYTPQMLPGRTKEHYAAGQVFHAPDKLAELTALRAAIPKPCCRAEQISVCW